MNKLIFKIKYSVDVIFVLSNDATRSQSGEHGSYDHIPRHLRIVEHLLNRNWARNQ